MKTGKSNKKSTLSTEQKIKEAARKIFHEKGFAATRTRDIAEEAGINLALLNYYFRSKEKLFGVIMFETLDAFLRTLIPVINDGTMTLEEKVEFLSSAYIDQLIVEPQIVLFIMSEIKNRREDSMLNSRIKALLSDSVILEQYRQAVSEGKFPDLNFWHFMINVIGLTIFPFMGASTLKHIGGLTDDDFVSLMQERKRLIPVWVRAMFAPA